ncbi:MAG: PAS domain S-box protein [Nitrospinae bacterium]|nr:PAS domain S-box protein [Nitrospinota bacterium]
MHKELLFKIKSLMVLRVLIISIFLGTIIIFQIKSGQLPLIVPVTILIAATYLLTIVYSLLLLFIKNLKFLCYLQLIGDLMVESGVIYISGGIESPFPFLYILSIIAASIVLYRTGSYITASAASILYGTLVNLEFYDILHPLTFYGTSANISLLGEAVIYTVFLNISAFYLVAFLSGYLSEKLKKAGEELEEKSEDFVQLMTFHENVVKNMGSGLVTADLNGRIVSLNQAGEGITGYNFEEVRGKPYQIFFNLPPLKIPPIPSFLKRGEGGFLENPVYNEVVFTRKDGRRLHLGMNISLLRDDKNTVRGTVAVFQDLTNIKEMEDKVLKNEKLAAIGRIAAGIAHEIRNPLASISGSIQVLKDEITADNTNKKLMEIILRETERLNFIITEFLIYASPYKKNLQKCNIKELVNETIMLLKNSKECLPGINITTNFENGSTNNGEIIINADPKQIKQVLWNLCLNSVQAMERCGTMKISVSPTSPPLIKGAGHPSSGWVGGFLDIIIEDTGTGIPEADLKKIFDPFFTTKEGGTGLGLSTVFKIIESHNGIINVESKVGKGTTVKITLPM